MSPEGRAALADRARGVLDRNRRGTWTIPSKALYPHQWLWDSCFTAIGLAHHDARRAAGEIDALFRGQWGNGMLPHMIFASRIKDIGSKRIWQSKRHAQAPRDVETSCITQPPLPAIASWRVAQHLPVDERRAFLANAYPRLVAYHRWLYRERDLEDRGLVTLMHPWECGLDTTPPWMRALHEMSEPWWVRMALKLRLARVARLFRRDTKFIPAAERASDGDGLRMLALARHAKRHDFELRRLPPDESVLIEDLAFNSLLCVSNTALGQIAEELGETVDGDLARSIDLTAHAFDQLWDDDSGHYCSRNAVTGDLLTIPTVATFFPLWAGVVDQARAGRLIGLLGNESEDQGFWPAHPVPSVPTNARQFQERRYWKGPTWVNTNWIVIQGLRVYGEHAVVNELTERTIGLVERGGCAEYFSALTGEAMGAEEFSWTAALVLDLLATESSGSV
ncbi:MAG: glycoside hydrolase [Actinobacteria bacterium]|nr:glycoside hydrolase [Actinomycetota bacterium]